MLERIETQVGHVCRFGLTEDPEDTAFVFEFIKHQATRLAKCCSRGEFHNRSASSTLISTAIWPETAMRSMLPPVRPMTRAGTFAADARSIAIVTSAGATEIATRDA